MRNFIIEKLFGHHRGVIVALIMWY